ncbi:MAG: hypothetical protein MUF64_25295, partial [Polyangiaceae bacterium]|nr:hypothetical protein [Polyangiaceae bacterium]
LRSRNRRPRGLGHRSRTRLPKAPFTAVMVYGRNDDAFEAALRPIFLRFLETTRRTAVVVLSTPGQLQTRRLAKPTSLNYQVFRVESEAIAFVDPRPSEPLWRRPS